MQIRMMGSVAMVVGALSLILSTGATAQTTKTEKKEPAPATVAVKHLKPQTTCPIMGGEIDKSQYVDINGKRIYVCCGGCLAQVKSDPDAAIKKLASMGQEPENIAPAKTGKAEPKKAAAKEPSPKEADAKSMDQSKTK